uniref:Uncharacterized protein n=1 Tax=Cannabis sativa TaxID=3483 RepID=A0A803PYD5_CANSA
MTNTENRGEDVENVFDGIDDDQNLEEREEEDDGNEYVKDGYCKDGYYYDHDPNLLQGVRCSQALGASLPALPAPLASVGVALLKLGLRTPYPSKLSPPPVDEHVATISGGPISLGVFKTHKKGTWKR